MHPATTEDERPTSTDAEVLDRAEQSWPVPRRRTPKSRLADRWSPFD